MLFWSFSLQKHCWSDAEGIFKQISGKLYLISVRKPSFLCLELDCINSPQKTAVAGNIF